MDLRIFFDCTLAILALINPVSKIFIISSISKKHRTSEIAHVCYRATLVSLFILLPFTFLGNFIVKDMFHVTVYSFQLVGGFVLVTRGIQAVNRGLFFEIDPKQKLEDLSIVPLASPMIAGPAAIAASISFPAQYGIIATSSAMVAALTINLTIMLFSSQIVKVLGKHHLLEALIRITGLIVATIGMQMMLDGLSEFLTIHYQKFLQ